MIFKPFQGVFPAATTLAARLACIVLLGATLLTAGQIAAGQSRQRQRPAPKPARPAPDAVVPFRSGEQLSFRVLWSKFAVNAAVLKLSVLERRNFFGRAAWHFRAQAQTVETTRLVYSLDDQFDSYTDAGQLISLQYEIYLREQGKQKKNIWRMSSQGSPAPPGATAARVPPGTRDPLGLLYALRAVDWKIAPEFRAPVFDGVHLYEVVARLGQAAGQVAVPAGTFKASRIDVRVFERGREMTDTRFALWLAQDAAHTPVLVEVEAPVPIGTARVELIGRP